MEGCISKLVVLYFCPVPPAMVTTIRECRSIGVPSAALSPKPLRTTVGGLGSCMQDPPSRRLDHEEGSCSSPAIHCNLCTLQDNPNQNLCNPEKYTFSEHGGRTSWLRTLAFGSSTAVRAIVHAGVGGSKPQAPQHQLRPISWILTKKSP